MTNTVYLALGSNIGDRPAFIHAALDAVKAFMTVEETSHLYETQPMLVTDQPLFLNAVCRGETDLAPAELLQALKNAEEELGRVKTIRYGPRNVDLDILFYNEDVIDTPDLTIPHERIPERDFVLAPLLDLEPDLRHPRLNVTVREMWDRLGMPVPVRVMPLGAHLWRWDRVARVMGIINMTPDSFTGDGLENAPDPLAAATARARQFIAEGADVLDVGGYSTRPGHADLTVETEIGRVAPAVNALCGEFAVPISVDTFRAEVAEAALDAGASWINDVSGLQGGSVAAADVSRSTRSMAALAAERRVPLVLVDNRAPRAAGDPDRDGPEYPSSGGIVADVRLQLVRSLDLARRAGLARWHRIVDPGVGFGKSVSQHAALISRLDELTALGYPLLFGASRKGFLGQMAEGAPVDERLPATIAANVLALLRGAQILRVHDVGENVQAIRVVGSIMADDSKFPETGRLITAGRGAPCDFL